MKLSDNERELLACVHLDAHMPVESAARQIGCPVHVAKYALKRLKENGIIRSSAVIDLRPLGFLEYAFQFSLSPEPDLPRDIIVDYLIASTSVIRVTDYGEDIMIVLAARTLRQVEEFLYGLSRHFTSVFTSKSMSAWASWVFVPRKYLSLRQYSAPAVTSGLAAPHVVLDKLDHEILQVLSGDQEEAVEAMARKLNIPPSTAHHRIRKLRERKVILGYIYAINGDILGTRTVRVGIALKGICAETRDAVESFLSSQRAIVSFVRCLGTWDFEASLEIEAESEIAGFTQALKERFDSLISELKVWHVVSRPKLRPYPFKTFEEVAVSAD